MKSRKRAFSLIEVVMAAALLAALMAFLGEALRQSQKVFRSTTGNNDASSELRKVVTNLRRELIQTRYDDSNCTSTLDGGVLWFLSNVDPSTGQPCYLSDGTPYWQRNIVYYLASPTAHTTLFVRSNCVLVAGAFGEDDRCPHKVLIRKEVDTGAATDANPANEANVETLIPAASISTYLGAPATYNLSSMVGGEIKAAKPVGHNMLSFHVDRQNGAIDCDLRAVSLLEAQRNLAVGGVSLYSTPYTISFDFSVFPQAK